MQSLPTTIAKGNEIKVRLQDTEIISTITKQSSPYAIWAGLGQTA